MAEAELGVYRGDTKSLFFTVKVNGIPVNLTDKTIYFAAKRSVEDGAYTLPKREAVMVDAPLGKIRVDLTSEDTNRDGQVIAELEYRGTMPDLSAVVLTVWQGYINFLPAVIT